MSNTWFQVAYRHLRYAEGVVSQRRFVEAITASCVVLTDGMRRSRAKPTVWSIAHRLMDLRLVITTDVGVWVVVNPEIWDALDTTERLGKPVPFKEYTDEHE